MAEYVTANEFGLYMKQLDVTAEPVASTVELILDAAESAVNGYLRFVFDGYELGERQVRAGRSAYFNLPHHEYGSVVEVALPDGTVIDEGWEETDEGVLYAVDAHGNEGGWGRGYYTVTAAWGHGPVPASVKEVVMEVAVNIWRSKDSGTFTNVIGVHGGGTVGYEKAMTPRQKLMLDNVKLEHYPVVVA